LAAALVPVSRSAAGAPDGESVVWEEITTAVAPPRASEFSTEYDEDHGITWLRGADGLWSWDGKQWARTCEAPPCHAPASSSGLSKSMTYDRARKRIVVLDGARLFEIDGAVATEPCASPPCSLHAPPPRTGAALVYDPVRRRDVLFGGRNGIKRLNDVWEWDGSAWSQRCTATPCAPPPARADGAAAFDGARGHVVVFGGDADDFKLGPMGMADDTWGWNGEAWTNLCEGPICASRPSARWKATMAFAPPRGRVILFGGLNPDAEKVGPTFNDTWEWDGARWMARSPTSALPPSDLGSLTWDARRGRAVLVQAGPTTMRVWEYHARGGTCGRDADCDTGHCVDGVCCETTCGACESCALAVRGVCAKVRGASDPDSCTGAMTCDRAGACLGAQGTACSASNECASGFCADGVCCDRRCDQPCAACAKARGAADDGTCGLAPAGDPGRPECGRGVCDGKSDACPIKCAVDGDCADGFVCGSAHTCTRKGPCDDHILTLEDGGTVDCAPNTCSAEGLCRTSCESVRDCVAPTVCNASGRCALPDEPAASSCGVGRAPDHGGGPGVLFLTFLSIFTRRRRRSPS
jgi:hypothetical protein